MQHPDDLLADFETRSRIDLRKAGARRYASDPSTGITTVVWFFRGIWKSACPVHPFLGSHSLVDLYVDLRQCRRFVAHHANFDVSILRAVNPFIDLPLSKIDCTMGRAQALALPGGLDEVCTTLGVRGKDPRGRALVMMTCKPQRDGTFNEDVQVYRELMEYCIRDVQCLVEVDNRLPPLSAAERLIFERTWRKNENGLPIDVHLATAIALRREEIESETTNRLMELTRDPISKIPLVTKLSQRQRIIDWVNGGNRAAGLESTQKHIVAEKLADENLHPDVRELLELLKLQGGSAPLKAQALLDRHIGGFYKDATRYFGARSGRGTSEGANMFNIARPSGKYDGEDGRDTIDVVIAGLKQGDRYDNTALTDCLRGCIVAPPGWMICDNDLSNAELRIALWMAGDTERLEILASGRDLYMANAIRVLRLPENATKKTHGKERQVFKSVTLGGNYQLGFRTYMAHQRREGRNIDENQARIDIEGYRQANPLLVSLWYALSDAFKFAIYEQPGRIFPAGKIAFQKDGNGTVWMLLPSGRAVPHYSAHITHGGEMAFFRGKFGAMLRQKAFGGSLLEIACQSITRDAVTEAEADMERELTDCHLILDVYDSVLAIAPAHVAAERCEQMRQIMERPRSWTAGLPLGADGYFAQRMAK
jgi:DNA polymerase